MARRVELINRLHVWTRCKAHFFSESPPGRAAANLALLAEVHAKRERATATESKEAQLEARIVDIK